MDYTEICGICNEARGEHRTGDYACPVYASFDPDYLSGFHEASHFTTTKQEV